MNSNTKQAKQAKVQDGVAKIGSSVQTQIGTGSSAWRTVEVAQITRNGGETLLHFTDGTSDTSYSVKLS